MKTVPARPRAPVAAIRSFQGHVIIHDDHFDRNAFCTRHLGRQAKVQPVAGVVLDHQQCSGFAATAWMAAKTVSLLGEVKTSPATAALSMPAPM
jgi:hypothetical protein